MIYLYLPQKEVDIMSIKINLGAWSSVFAVPSKIVDEGLKFSDGVKLKVLLYVLRNAGNNLTVKDISAATGVNVTDIPEALDYWVSMGILCKNDGEFAPVANEQADVSDNNSDKETKRESKQTAEEIAKDVNENKKRFVLTKPQRPDYVFTAQRLAEDEDLKILVNEAQTALGKTLSNSDISMLLMLKDTCGLPLDVIIMLIQYTISIDKANIRTIERIGVQWADAGVQSVEAADEKIRQANLSSKNYSIVKSAFGLSNPGSPTAKQLEYCNKWITEWKFSPDMLREAYERCVDTKGSMKFNYIDGILKRWHNDGIMNLNDLKELEAQKTAKTTSTKKRKTSYNIDELKKIDTLDFVN